MKRFILLILMLIIIPTTGFGAVYYVDLENGNDTSGDGSYTTPWKTLDKCTTDGATTGGDECRLAKVDTHTALSGTLTFTNGSDSVTTSVDLTGSLSSGDWIGKDTAGESWWEISSLTSSVITLKYEYWGSSATTTGYKADSYTLASNADFEYANSGTSTSSYLKISGGWDLTTQTQTGLTFILQSGSYYLPYGTVKEFLEISDFVFLYPATNYSGYSDNNNFVYYHDMQVCGDGWAAAHFMILEDFILSGGTIDGLSLTASGVQLINYTGYSNGTGLGDSALNISGSGKVFVDGLYLYNSYDHGIDVDSGTLVGSDITIDTTRYSGSDGMVVTGLGKIDINNVSVSNTIDIGVNYASDAKSNIHNLTLTSIGGAQEVRTYYSAVDPISSGPHLIISSYGGTANDDRMYFLVGSDYGSSRIQKDSTDARSGYCLKFTPYDGSDDIPYKVGTVKVVDDSSAMTLSVYAKDDASFDGDVILWAEQAGEMLSRLEVKSVTTSYAQISVIVASADLTVGDYIDFWIGVTGSAGSVFVDDFSYSQ